MNVAPKLGLPESEAVERLLSSQSISRAPRVQAVLAYLLDRLREGRPDEMTESRIGQAVFGRPRDYNPSEDNIVRVTVRHLRERLDRYYETEGSQEVWIVSIPKGNYVPSITARQSKVELANLGVPLLTDSPDAPIRQQQPRTLRPILFRGAVTLLVVANLCLITLLFLKRKDSSAGFVSDLFNQDQQISIIGSDSSLQLYRKMFNQVVPLQSYIDRTYAHPHESLSPELLAIWNYAANRKDTTTSSARAANSLQNALVGRTVRLRHPRDCTVRDLEHENVILIGGPWINPWGQLFEDRLNFRMVAQPSNMAGSDIVNTRPAADEPGRFQIHQEGAYLVSYVRLAMLSDLKDGGKAMLIGANSEEAIEAGTTFSVMESGKKQLQAWAHVKSIADLPSFEVVLEVRGLESTPRRVKIVAYRALED